jgi:hypothetical protein
VVIGTVAVMTGYFDVDSYGVPGRTLNLTDDFYGALGRIAALGALIELRMSDIVVQWGRETSDAGAFMQQLTDRIDEIIKARRKAKQVVPPGLTPAVKTARSAMDERNQLLHSLWPNEDAGWRNRPNGTEPTEYVGLAALRDVIGRLVEAVDGLGHYLYSPIEPTPLAPMRRRKNVPMHEAVDAHDLRSNKDRGQLQEEFRIDAWSKAIVKTARLRTISGDFQEPGVEWPLGKERLMTDNLESVRVQIEEGSWPRSGDIKHGLIGAVPPIHVEMCADGELFVIDGQRRVLTALWHGVEEVEGYVVAMDRIRTVS